MKKFIAQASIVVIGTILGVLLAVLYIPSAVFSRILAIPYFLFRYIERGAEAFFGKFKTGYKKAVEDKAKTLAGIKNEK